MPHVNPLLTGSLNGVAHLTLTLALALALAPALALALPLPHTQHNDAPRLGGACKSAVRHDHRHVLDGVV